MSEQTLEPDESLRIEKAVYGGGGLARTGAGLVKLIPFVLPGELVRGSMEGRGDVLEASPDRVEPRCVHFGVCGGCHYQMASYEAQLAMKQGILREIFERAGLEQVPEFEVIGSPEPWGYRNRVRMRVRSAGGQLRLGYTSRENEFLPVSMCPIAAPLLWRAAEALMRLATTDRDSALWLSSANEVELFCAPDESQLQIHLLCAGDVPKGKGSFDRFGEALNRVIPKCVGAGASVLDVRSGRAGRRLASWGAAGLAYPVLEERYWVTRGGFFQVNRFLLPRMVELVCQGRSGSLAWDLFAGVGLFSRVLARSFAAVTAVEANQIACEDLKRALAKVGPQHQAIQATTLEFLRRAVVERDRPELIVLDPPRAGLGEEGAGLLARLAPREIVYVSCDPTTLARDLRVLTAAQYSVREARMVDLFPQTYHLETVIVLQRGDVAD